MFYTRNDLYGVDAMTLDQLTALMADDEAKIDISLADKG